MFMSSLEMSTRFMAMFLLVSGRHICVPQRIKFTAKTVDEDPVGCKRWISRKEIKSAKI